MITFQFKIVINNICNYTIFHKKKNAFYNGFLITYEHSKEHKKGHINRLVYSELIKHLKVQSHLANITNATPATLNHRFSMVEKLER